MNNKSKLLIMVLLICIFTNLTLVYGEEGQNNNGDGNSKALYLVKSIPENSTKDVELDAQIKLLFNKNVVNFSVKDNNSQCFSIVDANNQVIPIDIIFPDDQIEPDKKREITLITKESFKENMTYTVKISSKLMAKNGNSLDENISFSFTTLALSKDTIDPNSQEPPSLQSSEEIVDNFDNSSSKVEQTANDIKAPIANQDKAISTSLQNTTELEIKEETELEEEISLKEDFDAKEKKALDKSTDPNQKAESNGSDDTNDNLDNKNNSHVSNDNTGTKGESNKFSTVYIVFIPAIIILAIIFLKRTKKKES